MSSLCHLAGAAVLALAAEPGKELKVPTELLFSLNLVQAQVKEIEPRGGATARSCRSVMSISEISTW
jgi:hypothetical protein